MKKLFKWLKYLLIVLIVLVVVVLAALPSIITHYVNNHGEELIGRQVHLADVDINYFNGKLGLEKLFISEASQQDTFFFLRDLRIDLHLLHCIQQRYHIESVTIEGLQTQAILYEKHFNFDDLIDRFATTQDSTEMAEDTSSAEIYYQLDHFALNQSKLRYSDLDLNSEIQLEDVSLQLVDGLSSDHAEVKADISMAFASGGNIQSQLALDLMEEKYQALLAIDSLQLNMLAPYVADFMWIQSFSGALNTDLDLKGDFNESSNIDIGGRLGLDHLNLVDTLGNRAAGLGNLEIRIDSMNPAKDVYAWHSLKLDSAFGRFELYPDDDNFSRMLIAVDSLDSLATASVEEDHYSNVFVMIGDYVKDALDGIKASNFSLDTLAIHDMMFYYEDHTLVKPFQYWITDIDLDAHDVDSDADSLTTDISALLNRSGRLKGAATFYPQKPRDVQMELQVDELAMKDISPYFHHYVAFPITKGDYRMHCSLSIKDNQLVSENDLELRTFKLGKKQKHDEAYNLPLKVAVAMLRDREGNIPINVPVEGNLKDPKYKVGKAIMRFLKELILKAATSPYKMIAASLDGDEAAAKKISQADVTAQLPQKQQKKLDQLAKLLVDKPQLGLALQPHYLLERQMEALALVKAKAEFLSLSLDFPLDEATLAQIQAVNEKDSLFQNHLNQGLKESELQQSNAAKASLHFDSITLKTETEKLIIGQWTKLKQYLMEHGVKAAQMHQGTIERPRLFDQSQLKNLQYWIEIDVIEEEVNTDL